MTWIELAERINRMTEEQQNSNISAYVQSMDEFFPVTLDITGENEDVLNPNEFFINVDG